jgi:hypothetical protein
MIEITKEIAQKVLDTVDAGLVCGVGKPIPGQMCVEAAVCYAMGLPHGDAPVCVAPSLRQLKLALNDSAWWVSDQSRSKGLRQLAVAQLDSAGKLDEKDFVQRLVPLANTMAARASKNAAAATYSPYTATALAARATASAASAAVAAAARAARATAIYAAVAAATYAAAYAAAAATYAAAAAEAEKELIFFADEVVKILIDMKAPGCQWLPLCEVSP